MLTSVVIHVSPTENTFLPVTIGTQIHALFLRLVASGSSTLANELHADQPVKPFTVSTLHGKFMRTASQLVALAGADYWFRVTTLSEPLFIVFNKVLLSRLAQRDTLDLAGGKFTVSRVDMEPRLDNQWGQISSFSDIVKSATAEGDIVLNFSSPTTFRSQGKNVPLPLPNLVFPSYLSKWNALSGLPLEEEILSWVEDNLAVESYRARTSIIKFDGFESIGFTGTCRFTALKKDVKRLKHLSILANFALYCGTGAKTTMGMGQTRRIK